MNQDRGPVALFGSLIPAPNTTVSAPNDRVNLMVASSEVPIDLVNVIRLVQRQIAFRIRPHALVNRDGVEVRTTTQAFGAGESFCRAV